MKIPAISVLSLLLASPAALSCDYPTKVNVPSGATATQEEMIQGQRDVKAYVAAMDEYLSCLLEEEKTARAQMDNLSAEDEQAREDMLNKKYNAAVDEMEKVAAAFNAEVRTYKARDE